MTPTGVKAVNRREFLMTSAGVCGLLASGLYLNPAYGGRRNPKGQGKRVIVIGIDGMDPRLSQQLMDAGTMPNLDGLRKRGGYKVLGTSIPPQSPVAWANFINGAGPGSHGIFDFIRRHPERQCVPFFAMAETVPGEGYWEVGDYRVQLDFWPFNHKPAATILRRQGTPFWDYLDKAKVDSTFYDLPSNYPPSESKYGHHRCLAGMGTPDMLGTYGTYQHFAEDGPLATKDEGGGKRSMLVFENEKARARLIGPLNNFLKRPEDSTIEFFVYRDRQAKAAVIEIQKQRLLLKERQWSRWVKVDFVLSTLAFLPDKHVGGIVRFYLQEVDTNFRLYVSPINSDPEDSALNVTEPPGFIKDISKRLGLFYTTGFQEDHKALSNKVFSDEEFRVQADMVLEERMRLLEYAMENYDDGLLFFYFSSTDLQSHMFWWDSQAKHPTRSAENAKKYFGCISELYQKMDSVVGDIMSRYGDKATIIVMSDHGFANFRRQFGLNRWLKGNGYIYPPDASSVLSDVDWSKTKAYGLGINGLYVNLRGRERDGIVERGAEYEGLIEELAAKLEAVKDVDGRSVIHKMHRADKVYSGGAMAFAPDLIIGYARDYRASWDTCLGDMQTAVLCDNDSAWSADHCADVTEVPGVLFCNRAVKKKEPALIDLAPTILSEFGLPIPRQMEGTDIFKS